MLYLIYLTGSENVCLGPYQNIAARRGMAGKNPLTSMMKRSLLIEVQIILSTFMIKKPSKQ